MPKKKRKTIFPKELTKVTPVSKALTFILTLALPFIGFLFGISYQPPVDKENASLVVVPSVAPEVLTTEDTSTWKIYTNKDQGYGFSFKHPKDWSAGVTDPEQVIFFITTPQTKAYVDAAKAKNMGYSCGYDIALQLMAYLDLDLLLQQDSNRPAQKMIIGGQEWYRYKDDHYIYYETYTQDKKFMWEFRFNPATCKEQGSEVTEKQLQSLISTFKIAN